MSIPPIEAEAEYRSILREIDTLITGRLHSYVGARLEAMVKLVITIEKIAL